MIGVPTTSEAYLLGNGEEGKLPGSDAQQAVMAVVEEIKGGGQLAASVLHSASIILDRLMLSVQTPVCLACLRGGSYFLCRGRNCQRLPPS